MNKQKLIEKTTKILNDSDAIHLVNSDDVAAVVNSLLLAIEDSLKHGEEISIHGFGKLGLAYRKPRYTKHPHDNKPINIDGRWIPKFKFGNDLRVAAQIYEMSLESKSGKNKRTVQDKLFELSLLPEEMKFENLLTQICSWEV